MKKSFFPIICVGLWIVFSEFVRNELLFKHFWIQQYQQLGLQFETTPLNGIFWLIWSMIFAASIFILLRRFTPRETIAIAWVMGFVLMWIPLYNLRVLPLRLVYYALPMSVAEVVIAVSIIKAYEYVQTGQSHRS
jgi:hypothetical protein